MSHRRSALPEYLCSLLAMFCWVVPLLGLSGLVLRHVPVMDRVVADPAAATTLAAFFLLICVGGWLGQLVAFTIEPKAKDAPDFLRVTYFATEEEGQGGLWLSRTTVHLVTGLRHRTIALASLRDARVEPTRHWFVGLNRFAKDFPLVLELDDGSVVRAFVYAPHSLASEILATRDASADAAPPQPYRRSVARA